MSSTCPNARQHSFLDHIEVLTFQHQAVPPVPTKRSEMIDNNMGATHTHHRLLSYLLLAFRVVHRPREPDEADGESVVEALGGLLGCFGSGRALEERGGFTVR